MDRLEALGTALSQVSMYDIKSMYNQAKNMVMNVSEMEGKVREATNDDPWGASSTLMQEIAQGQQFNEIMPCIYARFMDKEARQWHEIYKALQLLEYIVKHGSERVVDDARSHLSTIKMLRNFHYIDDKGKDQGINVRNRAKEISELLMDVERIRNERRKAKANRNKYVGTGNDGMSFSGGSDARYGGYGGDDFGSGSGSRGGGYDNDFGGYGGGSSSGGFRDDAGRRGFDEYNAGDDEVTVPRRSNSLASGSVNRASIASTPTPAPTPVKAPAKDVDLLGFMEDDAFSTPVPAAPLTKPAEKALPALASNPLDDGGDDDFADFQAAPPSATIAPAKANNVFDVLGAASQSGFPQSPVRKPIQPVQPTQSPFGTMSPTLASRSTFTSPVQAASPSASASAFGGTDDADVAAAYGDGAPRAFAERVKNVVSGSDEAGVAGGLVDNNINVHGARRAAACRRTDARALARTARAVDGIDAPSDLEDAISRARVFLISDQLAPLTPDRGAALAANASVTHAPALGELV
ncbi:hypothetical protein EW145_g7425, partial [Phellinidium pouzarii]